MNTMLILREAHSGWRMLVILVVLLALIKFLVGWLGNQRWKKLDQIIGAATPIVIDIQWLLGTILWIMQQRWTPGSTLISWEHPVTMTLALIVGHVTWSRAKRSTSDVAKFRIAFVGFLITVLLIAIGVSRILGTSNIFAM